MNPIRRGSPIVDAETKAAVMRILDSGQYILGEQVREFEKEFAAYCDATYCVGVSSCTSALWLALIAHGIGPGDEVITTPISFYSTAAAAVFVGARPAFVDVDPKTLNLDPSLLEAAITPRTKAIIPVHLYGHPADMDPIVEIAQKHGLAVIEDAAEAHGSLYKGRKVGSDRYTTTCFSFYPTKNIMAAGDGGCVVTCDPKVDEAVRQLRYFGMDSNERWKTIGYNMSLGEIGAAVARGQLKHLDEWNYRRREISRMYKRGIRNLSVRLPVEMGYSMSCCYMYVVRAPFRSRLTKFLDENQIEWAIRFEPVLYKIPPLVDFVANRAKCPVAEVAVKEVLSIPMNAALKDEEVERVCHVINTWS